MTVLDAIMIITVVSLIGIAAWFTNRETKRINEEHKDNL